MVAVNKPPKLRVRLKLLASIGKEIAGHEAAIVTLRQTRDKLIRQHERARYETEIEQLRALVANYEMGFLPGCTTEIMQMIDGQQALIALAGELAGLIDEEITV